GAHFGGGSKTVGFLYAAPYAGALVASIFSGPLAHVGRQGLGVVIAAAAWGVALVGFGFATTLWLALLLLAFAGAADFVSSVLRPLRPRRRLRCRSKGHAGFAGVPSNPG